MDAGAVGKFPNGGEICELSPCQLVILLALDHMKCFTTTDTARKRGSLVRGHLDQQFILNTRFHHNQFLFHSIDLLKSGFQ